MLLILVQVDHVTVARWQCLRVNLKCQSSGKRGEKREKKKKNKLGLKVGDTEKKMTILDVTRFYSLLVKTLQPRRKRNPFYRRFTEC